MVVSLPVSKEDSWTSMTRDAYVALFEGKFPVPRLDGISERLDYWE